MKKIFLVIALLFIVSSVAPIYTTAETVYEWGGQCDASKPVRVELYSYTEWNGEFTCQGFGYVRKKDGKKVCAVNGTDYTIYRSSRCEYQYMINCDGEPLYFNI